MDNPFEGFLSDLCDKSVVNVNIDDELQSPNFSEDEIKHWDQVARLDAPGTAPTLNCQATQWACRQLYLCCRFIVDRRIDAGSIVNALQSGPESPSANDSNIWSVDLCFRQLPKLFRICRNISSNDVLLDIIRSLASDWPLSAPGISDVKIQESLIPQQRCLKQTFIERIITFDDRSKIINKDIRDTMLSHLGVHSELNPSLNNALKEMPV